MSQENFEKDFLEVERKFEVANIDFNKIKENTSDILKIYQAYFVDEDGKYKRIRLQSSFKDYTQCSVVCEKIQVGMLENVPLLKEIEEEHPFEYGVNLINEKNLLCIEKTRYIIPINGYIFEIDHFHNLTGEFKNLVTAEVEFSSEKNLMDFNKIELPSFIVKELTGDKKFSNANLSKYVDKNNQMPYKTNNRIGMKR